MKRLVLSAVTVAALCFVSCSVPMKNEASRPNRLGESFSGDVAITIEKMHAAGRLERSGGDWNVEFSEPNTLSGVSLGFSDGSVTASYKGLSFSVPQSAVPVKAMMLNLIKAVDENSASEELKGEEKDGMLRLNGKLDGGSYVLSVDDNGFICGFDMPGYELSMTFMNIAEGADNMTASDTTAEAVTTVTETAATSTTQTVEQS